MLARLVELACWTGLCFILWGSGGLVLLVAPGPRERWRRAWFRRWARGVAWVLGMAIETHRSPPTSHTASHLLVTNHLSYVDIVLLASQVPGIFVAKKEVRRWPIWGSLARLMGTIFLDRGRRRDTLLATAQIDKALARGETVILFAEGTSTEGSMVQRFKPALLEPAARAGVPVHYASLSYHTTALGPPASEAVCWWGDMRFLPHLMALCRLPGFRARIDFGDDPIVDWDRKSLARRLHHAVSYQFVPSVP